MKPYRLAIIVPGLPKTTNSGGRAHWAAKVKEAKLWIKTIGFTAIAQGLPPKPLEFARLTLIRFSLTCPDPDGLVSSFKHVIDGLVNCGVLANDRFENIGMPDYRWEKAKQKQGSIFVVVEQLLEAHETYRNGKTQMSKRC